MALVLLAVMYLSHPADTHIFSKLFLAHLLIFSASGGVTGCSCSSVTHISCCLVVANFGSFVSLPLKHDHLMGRLCGLACADAKLILHLLCTLD